MGHGTKRKPGVIKGTERKNFKKKKRKTVKPRTCGENHIRKALGGPEGIRGLKKGFGGRKSASEK